MLLALVLACGAVALEMASESGHRASYLRRRLDRLQARSAQMESRLTASNREIAEMEREAEARREFSRILYAPDGRLIRLVAVKERSGLNGVVAGVVAMSHASAVLELTGLPMPAPGQHYSLWWIRRRGAPIVAGQVAQSERAQTEAVVRLSPPPAETEAVELRLESPEAGGKLVGSPILKGEVRASAKH
jgi:hypothetical protein